MLPGYTDHDTILHSGKPDFFFPPLAGTQPGRAVCIAAEPPTSLWL